MKTVTLQAYDPEGQLKQLCRDYCSCVRYSYKRYKEGLKQNEVRRKMVVRPESKRLNSRYIDAALSEAKGVFRRFKDETVVFGGKAKFRERCEGKITREEWRFIRDSHVYTQGQAASKGNPNIRIIKRENGSWKLRVAMGGKRNWIELSLTVFDDYLKEIEALLLSGEAYSIRLTDNGDHTIKVAVTYKPQYPEVTNTLQKGSIGVDMNPRSVGVSVVSADGNLVEHRTISLAQAFDSKRDKAKYLVSLVAKEIVELAKQYEFGITIEQLKFNDRETDFVDGGRRWNRTRSGFCYRTLAQTLTSLCKRTGTEIVTVNPAYTSVIGRIKYAPMHNCTVHESAAYVIGRRGLGFKERLSVYGKDRKAVKTGVLSSIARAGSPPKRLSNWALWSALRRLPILTGSPSKLGNPRELPDSLTNGNGGWRGLHTLGESPSRTSRRRGKATCLPGKKGPGVTGSSYI